MLQEEMLKRVQQVHAEAIALRLTFQARPWDLYLSIGYTVAVTAGLLAFGGNFVALPLVLFVPGYVLVAVVHPGKKGIDWIERFALGFGLSLAVVPLIGFGLSLTGFGIRPAPVFMSIALLTTASGVGAYWRRTKLPVSERLSATIEFGWPRWNRKSLANQAALICLAAGVTVAAASLAYLAVAPHPEQPYSEFYLLGANGTASGYPSTLNVSQTGALIIVLASHESVTTSYEVRIDLVGVRLIYNTTSGRNETVEINRTTWSQIDVMLANGQNWTQFYSFSIASRGMWKLQFLLYKENVLTSQELHLFILVT